MKTNCEKLELWNDSAACMTLSKAFRILMPFALLTRTHFVAHDKCLSSIYRGFFYLRKTRKLKGNGLCGLGDVGFCLIHFFYSLEFLF